MIRLITRVIELFNKRSLNVEKKQELDEKKQDDFKQVTESALYPTNKLVGFTALSVIFKRKEYLKLMKYKNIKHII